MTSDRWVWEKTDPSRSGSSGDLSKLFRHETAKNPGILGRGAPPSTAALMAREVIQNSWDAARELKESDEAAPDFEIAFSFEQREGDEKALLAQRLGLQELARRADSLDRNAIGLKETDCLRDLDGGEPLPILVIHERGTTGMYGPWKGAQSKMYLALVSLGYTEKRQGAGGSYGFGKAGLIRGSAIRTVVAYTCFRETAEEPGITRRLLGMTYWGQHDFEGTNFTGFARYGAERDLGIEPFANEEADEAANLLGLEVRQPNRPEDLGTTFLVVDPRVDPHDLLAAIERSWWPAIEDGEFEATVKTQEGAISHPRPMRDEVLRSFVRAYEVALTPQDNVNENERHFDQQRIESNGHTYASPGRLGLVADMSGWSYADVAEVTTGVEPIEHRSLVALVRGPRMVVEYLDAGRTAPYVRGCFIAGDSVDEELRKTEPKGHDSWQTRADEGEIDTRAVEIANNIIKRIKNSVQTFRSQIKPPALPPEEVTLPLFDRVLRSVLAGHKRGTVPPIAETRPVSIRLNNQLESAPDGKIRLEGSVSYSLSDHFEDESASLSVSLFYRFLEDGKVGEYSALEIVPPDGFIQTGERGVYTGELAKGEEATFLIESGPYTADWSGRLIANGDIIDSGGLETE